MEEGKSGLKDSQSESSDAASTIKRWDNRWVPSEAYDSSGTTSTSEPGEDYAENCRPYKFDVLGLNNQSHTFCKSQGCLCQSCLLGYARVIALQGSMPNVCTANATHFGNLSYCNTPYFSVSNDLPHHASKESTCSGFACSVDHHSVDCYMSQSRRKQHTQQSNKKVFIVPEPGGHETGRSVNNSATQNHRCVGSLDRRRRKFKHKIERDHRAKSQSDLLCCEQRNTKPLHYCSLQYFHCLNNPHTDKYSFKTEERLQKLENERSALHMEISGLSEQVDAQSNKIVELENILQEKKDNLRHIEDSLQKEVLSRSALETQKLELLTSLSEMKLRLASLEHENLALRNSNPVTNSERFSRHAGLYSSLPRPPTSTKKGVVFADEEKTVISNSVAYGKLVPTKSFNQLTVDEIGEWLLLLGLESYTHELIRWGATGEKLLDASFNQIEKELDIKNVLHRKKLLYAIESEKSKGIGFFGSEKMDNSAVLRWLDDIGLPQHKEAFHNAKVDGRVLHRLTTEDLLLLNVTAQLHAASLRRGIQLLRNLNFEFDDLERRSSNDNCENSEDRRYDITDKYNGKDNKQEMEHDQNSDKNRNKNQVSLWTNHRVMEWLRVVDLAEYAPNMRGSGVHGALMVFEDRFTSELLATLLSIAPEKTLLRRHLTTHFNQIVGRDVVQQKRETENTLGFIPLTLVAKIKVPKRTQFTLKRKKSKNEVVFGNLVCPLEESPPGTPSLPSASLGSLNLNSPTH